MMTDEDYSKTRKAKTTSIRTFFPVIGLILMIAFGVVAYLMGPILTNAVSDLISLPPDQYETFDWVSRGIVFIILSLITGLIYAAAAPKPKQMVSERALDKERKARIQGELEAKKRKNQVRAKMAQERKKNEQKK
jgi:hypothetical protein